MKPLKPHVGLCSVEDLSEGTFHQKVHVFWPPPPLSNIWENRLVEQHLATPRVPGVLRLGAHIWQLISQKGPCPKRRRSRCQRPHLRSWSVYITASRGIRTRSRLAPLRGKNLRPAPGRTQARHLHVPRASRRRGALPHQ